MWRPFLCNMQMLISYCFDAHTPVECSRGPKPVVMKILISMSFRKRLWMNQVLSSRMSCRCPLSTRRKKLWASPLSSTGKTAGLLMNTMNRSLRSAPCSFHFLSPPYNMSNVAYPVIFYLCTCAFVAVLLWIWMRLSSLMLSHFHCSWPGPDTVLGLVSAELRHLWQAEPYGV